MWPEGRGHKPERLNWSYPQVEPSCPSHFLSCRFQKFNPAWPGGSRIMGRGLTPATFAVYQYVNHKAHLFRSHIAGVLCCLESCTLSL